MWSDFTVRKWNQDKLRDLWQPCLLTLKCKHRPFLWSQLPNETKASWAQSYAKTRLHQITETQTKSLWVWRLFRDEQGAVHRRLLWWFNHDSWNDAIMVPVFILFQMLIMHPHISVGFIPLPRLPPRQKRSLCRARFIAEHFLTIKIQAPIMHFIAVIISCPGSNI